jgi:DNA-binding MurR/RpiR family transcriptional regulator
MDESPEDFAGLEQRFFSLRDSLPRRLSQVGHFVMAHADEVAFGTAASIAQQAGVQPSTLVRFAQAMGLEGYSSLQRLCQGRMRKRVAGYAERLAAAGDEAGHGAGLLGGFLDAGQRSLELARAAVSPENFENAVEILSGARTIYLLAWRRAYPVASAMSYAFGQAGIHAVEAMSSAGNHDAFASQAGPEDVVMAISFSPYAAETAGLARQLASRGVPVVAMTDSAFSPLASCSSVWLTVAEADHAGFRSLAASVSVALALCVAVADRRRNAVE